MIYIERYPLKRCQGCVKLIASKVNCFLNITDLSEVQLHVCMSSNSWTWECPHTKDGADHVPLIFLSRVYSCVNYSTVWKQLSWGKNTKYSYTRMSIHILHEQCIQNCTFPWLEKYMWVILWLLTLHFVGIGLTLNAINSLLTTLVDVYTRQTLPDRVTVDVSHEIWCTCVWTGWRLLSPRVAKHTDGWRVFTHALSWSPWDVTLGYPTTMNEFTLFLDAMPNPFIQDIFLWLTGLEFL